MKCFKYLGLNIKHEENIITLDQKNYVDNLIEIDIDIDHRQNPTLPSTTTEKEVLLSKIGQLLWLRNRAHLDVSFQSVIWHPTLRATINELIQCHKTISKLKYINLKL